jgi:transcriptional regulator with XRE-family HTH domain
MQLSDYLTQRGLKQAEFASMIGVSEAAVSRWATGKGRPSWAAVAAIERSTDGAVAAKDFMSAPAGDIGGREAAA